MATDSQVKEGKHNIGPLMKELIEAAKCEPNLHEQKATDIIRILDNVNDKKLTAEDVSEIPDKIIDEIFLILLEHKSESVKAKTAMTIAELGKTEEGRNKCTNEKLVKVLLGLLMLDDIDVLTQTSRALGNICCDNEQSRKLIRESTGLNYIVEVLKKGISLENAEGASVLRNASAGFLLNFLAGETLADTEVLIELIVPYISSILEVDGPVGGESATYVLLSLGILNDSNVQYLNERLTKALVNILENHPLTELSEMCLEALQGQAEDDNSKLLMASNGVCDILIKFLEKHSTQCSEEVIVMSCNIIVLVLTGDESMKLLYDNGNGFVYNKLIEWLEHPNEELQVNAILAMGNFARSDKNCETMVMQNVHQKLLMLISKNSTQNTNVSVQYALLSTLRNLVIPAKNKPILLEAGLIDILSPMLNTSARGISSLMLFKLLGTFRIVIDGQSEAATTLGTKTDIIAKAVEWSSTEDNPGLQGESCRLIAWLVTNSKNETIIESVIKNEGIKPLVKMLKAQHAIMQHEGILSLIVLVTSLIKSEQLLIEANIGENFHKLLDEKAQNMQQTKFVPETINIIRNAITMNEALLKSDALKEHLIKSDVAASWKKILESPDAELAPFRDSIQSLCSKMEVCRSND